MATKILLYGHGGSFNHGCEALVRTTGSILKTELNRKPDLTLMTFRPNEDRQVGLDMIDHYLNHSQINRWSLNWLVNTVVARGLHQPVLAGILINSPRYSEIKPMDLCISIGGDNYCYGKPYWMYALNYWVKKAGKKLILWGCSIEPNQIDSEMEKDLNRYDLIIARESLTYQALLERQIHSGKVLAHDPAFTLERVELPLPANWLNGNTIGINISPLVMKLERKTGITFKAVSNLIEHILKNTKCNIALIPHVNWENNDDSKPLAQLYCNYRENNRVILIDGRYNALQLKGFIARCRMFIGARTHATIAAYSTNVPTLVLGYSIKARGIARDIFGDETGLVLPVQNLDDEKQLSKAFAALQERENELRLYLQKVMPEYIRNARQAGAEIRKLIEKIN